MRLKVQRAWKHTPRPRASPSTPRAPCVPQCLNLSFNQLSGALPPDLFAHCTALVELNLSGNKFAGPLPPSTSCLTRLEVCAACIVRALPTPRPPTPPITNTPPHPAPPPAQVLRAYGNELSGRLHPGLAQLGALRTVNLSRNKFTAGSQVFNACTELAELQLNDNQFADALSPTIASLCSLRLLYLQNNKLHGRVPDAIVALRSLRHLNLSNNNLSGPLPADIGALTHLETLLVGDTYVTGPIPQSITQLVNLRDFIVNKPFPGEAMHATRGFQREKFERLHMVLPGLGMDSLVWDDEVVHGRILPPPPYDPTHPNNYNSFRNSWQSMLDAGYGLGGT